MKKITIVFILILLAAFCAKSQTELRGDVNISSGTKKTTLKQDSIFKLNTNRTHFLFNRRIEALNYLYLDSARTSYIIGYKAGYLNTKTRNVHFGHEAGYFSDAANLINIGYQAGYVSGEHSISIGSEAGYSTGEYTINIGSQAGFSNTTSFGNINIGYKTGYTGIGNNYNILIGHAIATNVSLNGDYNCFIGAQHLINSSGTSTGYSNTSIGHSNLPYLTDGYNNTVIGANCADSLRTGSGNIFIGKSSGIGEKGSNTLYIGTNTLGNYPLIYGNFSSEYLNIKGDLAVTDGKSFKIKDSSGNDSLVITETGSLCSITSINPVYFGVTTALFTPKYRFSLVSNSAYAISTALTSPVVSFLNASNSSTFTSIVLSSKTSASSHTTLINKHIGSNSSDFIISNCINNFNGYESFALRANGNITLYGGVSRVFSVDRNLTATSDGSNLEFYSGGATSGGTDKNSGHVLIGTSTSVGSGYGYISLLTTTAGSTGTSDNAATEKVRITSGGDVLILANTNGIILKDDAGTAHYWRVTISSLGVLTTTDVGTTEPQ